MSDEKIPSRKGKVSTTEEIRRMRNKRIVPDMKAMKRSRNSDGKLYLNADHPSVTKNEVKRFNKIFSQGTGAGSAPHTLSERQVHNAYSMMKKKFVNPDGSPDNLTNKEIKDLTYRKGQTGVRVNPVPKKIKQSKKMGGGKVYKYKKGTSDKTIIGKNKGMRGSEKPSSLGADKTKGIDPKFSSRVKKQNEQGMKEAANILKQASDQKLNSPPPKNKGLKKLPKNVRNKMGFKKHGGKITYRMSGGQVVAGSYE